LGNLDKFSLTFQIEQNKKQEDESEEP